MNKLLAGDRVTSKTLWGVFTILETNYDGSCVIVDSEGDTYTVHMDTLAKA